MTKTPWNWIITAFILAALFLASFGKYRTEVKNNSNNTSEVQQLRQQVRTLNDKTTNQNKEIEKNRKTIARLNTELEKEKKNKPTQTVVYTNDNSEEINRLNKINKQLRDSIRTLNQKNAKLQQKIDYYKN